MTRRIMFLDKSRVFSGAEYSLLQLIQAIDRSRYDPVICSDYPMPHQHQYEQAAIETCFRADSLSWWMGSDRWKRPIRGSDCVKRFILGRRLARILRTRACAILHHNLVFPNSYLDLWFAKRQGAKVVGHVRSLAPWFRLSPRLLRMCDVVICVSEIVKRNVLSWYEHPKVLRAYDPIDASRYGGNALDKVSAKRAIGVPSDRRVVSSVALLSPHKGHDVAIRAFASVSREFQDLDLYIVGGSADYGLGGNREQTRLQTLASDLGVGNRVFFSGRQVADVEVAYAASEFVYALTIYGEAFGRVPLEAGAARRIVIATNVGATPEIVRHEATGILVPPGDSGPVAEWTRRLLREPQAYARLASAAQEHVQREFAPQRYARYVEHIYDELIAEG